MTSGFQDIYTTPDTGGKNKVHAYRKALVLFLLLYGLTNCNWKKSELLQISKKKKQTVVEYMSIELNRRRAPLTVFSQLSKDLLVLR